MSIDVYSLMSIVDMNKLLSRECKLDQNSIISNKDSAEKQDKKSVTTTAVLIRKII